jgi:polyisoprenoid-binding protein YceI
MSTHTTVTHSAGAALYAVDPAHTQVEFAVRHLMISTVRGSFKDVQGTVRIDESDPARTAADVRINIASIDTREPQRDAHLRSPDFFDADRFPVMTFQGRHLVGSADGPFKLVGDLTIRDVTREVVVDVTPEGRLIDPWGNERVGFSATAKISRGDFGLKWNQALEAGGVVVGDEVKISIDVELVKQAAAAA